MFALKWMASAQAPFPVAFDGGFQNVMKLVPESRCTAVISKYHLENTG